MGKFYYYEPIRLHIARLMTRPFDPSRLQFYVTVPSPCPYLDGQMERKIFTQLDPLSGPHLNDYLTHSGFRRSQNVIYRPACENCRACQSLRVICEDFEPNKGFRRTLRKNADLKREILEPYATREQFALLRAYLSMRHKDGGMSAMEFHNYEIMVEECASRTLIIEYRNAEHVLVACVLVDELSDGLSMVYSFFDPEMSARSLGNFMILDHVNLCKLNKLPYLYLGYWVKDSPKMNYKSRFKPAQLLKRGHWVGFEDAAPTAANRLKENS